MRYAKQESIKKLARELNLPVGDRFTQDWEYEVADSKKIDVFLSYYRNNELNPDEKRTLMKIILESYNDYVGTLGYNNYYSNELNDILQRELSLYSDLIDDWSCGEEDLEDCFAITSFMRKLRKSC